MTATWSSLIRKIPGKSRAQATRAEQAQEEAVAAEMRPEVRAGFSPDLVLLQTPARGFHY